MFEHMTSVALNIRKFRISCSLVLMPENGPSSSVGKLSFSQPFSDGKVEQIFSSSKLTKTAPRTNMPSSTLNDLLKSVLKDLS